MREITGYVICVIGNKGTELGYVFNVDFQRGVWDFDFNPHRASIWPSIDRAKEVADFCTDPEAGPSYVVRKLTTTLGPICG